MPKLSESLLMPESAEAAATGAGADSGFDVYDSEVGSEASSVCDDPSCEEGATSGVELSSG